MMDYVWNLCCPVRLLEKKGCKMEKEYIFTEDPEEEMWQTLLQFSYEANIKRYLTEHGFAVTDDLVNNISGSVLQAYEYYSASKHTNLQIKPLLLYYGTTNLLYGICNLLTGTINTIQNHGMRITPPQAGCYIGNTEIAFENPGNGGVHVFLRCMGYQTDLTKYGMWTIKEMLSSVPELCSDYKKCYSEKFTNTFLLVGYNTPEGKLEKIHADDGIEVSDIITQLRKVDGFSKSYLSPVIPSNGHDIVLRHKMNGKDISQIAYSGQPYLSVAHEKQQNLLTLPQLMYMYIALFALGSLCRYRPEIWSPFVKNDNTGEKLLIERFLHYARRLIPNYVINHIQNKDVIYSGDKYMPINTVKMVGEHQVREIVSNELQKREERKVVRRVFEK